MKYRIHKLWLSWRVSYPRGFKVFNTWEEARAWVWIRLYQTHNVEDLSK